MSRPQGPHNVDRDLPEFLQEVRVAQTGGQIFFAFLFTIAFSPGFDALDDGQQTLYLVTADRSGAAGTGSPARSQAGQRL